MDVLARVGVLDVDDGAVADRIEREVGVGARLVGEALEGQPAVRGGRRLGAVGDGAQGARQILPDGRVNDRKIMPRASALGSKAGTHRALTEGGGPR